MPKREWSRAQQQMVARMAAARVPVAEIAKALGVSDKTVRRHFAHLLHHGPGPAPNAYSPQQRAFVEAMAGYAIPQEDIAAVLGIAPDTLRRDFEEELRVGPVKMNVRVVTNLFKQTADSPAAAIYWTKARLGWRDRTVLEHEHRGVVQHAGHVDVAVSLDVREAVQQLSPDGRAALRVVLAEMGAASLTAVPPAPTPVH